MGCVRHGAILKRLFPLGMGVGHRVNGQVGKWRLELKAWFLEKSGVRMSWQEKFRAPLTFAGGMDNEAGVCWGLRFYLLREG